MANPEPPPSSQSQSQTKTPQPPPALSHHAGPDTTLLQTYTSIGALIFCPLLIALPPRKFDFYTVLLLGGTALSGNHLLRQYTERGGIAERARRFLPQHQRGRAQESDQVGVTSVERQWQGERQSGVGGGNDAASTRPLAVSRAVQELRGDEAGGSWGRQRGRDQDLDARKVRAKPDWKAVRDAKEREALEEGGKGYGGLIVDQIWEVWSWGRDRGRGGDDRSEGEEGREGKK